MRTKRYLVWGGALAMLGAAAIARPARLVSARLSALTPGAPPTANITLVYGSGALPVSVIVDVYDRNGGGGSATIPGAQLFVEIPISGNLAGDYRLTVTATYRLMGRPWTRVREFEGGLPLPFA